MHLRSCLQVSVSVVALVFCLSAPGFAAERPQSSSTASASSANSSLPQSGTPSSPAANASQSSSSTTSASATEGLTLQQRIAKLPPLKNVNIDVNAHSRQILAHLNDILRFYRAATEHIQRAGEPSDILYAEQARAQATQIAQLAFESARNEAQLLLRMQASAGNAGAAPPSGPNGQPSDAQRLAAARARVQDRIAALQAQQASIADQLTHANAKTRPDLLQQQEQLHGGLQLEQATMDALNRISAFTSAQGGHTGLLGDIERLESSAPELTANGGKAAPVPSLESFSNAQSAGIVTQASLVFDLLSARRSIDQQIKMIDDLRNQANTLRTPFVNVLRSTVQQGEALTQQTIDLRATPTTDAQDLANTRKQFDQLAATFHVLADAMLPLSQEVVMLGAERGTLSSWRIALDSEYKSLLRSLLVRVGEIAAALFVLMVLGQLWSRATVRYVQDLRRRRQLLLVRRIVVGFLSALVVLFGFITQFSSLATFAGFLTAGIAVGLQTILLSVAAYFFIIGRYGVKVGDRITVAGVTGTVIEVGIARFYMMELVGSGTELHSTGRVAVFANSVLFQTGTPLYKQLPGTEYAWHELTAKLKPEADSETVSSTLCGIIEDVYKGYKPAIEAQQQQIESWMGAPVDRPRVDSHLRMTDDGLEIAILFPVEIDGAAQADAAIASAVIKAMQTDGPLKQGLASVPAIKAAIKS